MSVVPVTDPECSSAVGTPAIAVIDARERDLGGVAVRRVLLPAPARCMVGPFTKQDWRAGRFPNVPGELERTPLPEM
jgi:hypothetical protein